MAQLVRELRELPDVRELTKQTTLTLTDTRLSRKVSHFYLREEFTPVATTLSLQSAENAEKQAARYASVTSHLAIYPDRNIRPKTTCKVKTSPSGSLSFTAKSEIRNERVLFGKEGDGKGRYGFAHLRRRSQDVMALPTAPGPRSPLAQRL